MTDNFDQQLDEAIQEINAKNAAHYVYYEIEKLYTHQEPENVRKRWIWELLQNAHDARGADGIITEVRYNPSEGELVFLHNGCGFKAGEIVHLIKAGTTKDEDDQETHGKFGRGFLTTHLLSPTVEIAGQLANGKWFDFTLKRDNETKDTLEKSLEGSLNAFYASKSDNKPAIPEGFTTQFMFRIRDLDAEKAVKAGIDALEQCAPYVIVFNREFFSINIKKPDRTKCFKFDGDYKLDASGIQQVPVVENDTKMEYLLAENKQQKTSVAVRIKSNEENSVCLSVENIPKLFSAFPLVGTSSLSFPAVINNPNFSLPADRDRVQFDKNQYIFEEACNLLVNLIEHAALERWDYVHRWAKIPNTEFLSQQMEPEWETCIKNLIEKIRQTPVVLTQSGNPKTPAESMLPVPEKSENVESLWELLEDWQEYREKLPRRNEASGWYNAIGSWGVYEREAFDGRQLARDIQGCSGLNVLRNMLQEGVCAIEWLDRFYEFLKKDELFNNVIHDYSFVPNQVGEFNNLEELYSDKNVDQELKEIGNFFDIEPSIKESLRHTLLKSLGDEVGAGAWDNKSVVDTLIDELKCQVSYNQWDNFRIASPRLFAWIVRNEEYSLLQGFPVFAEAANSDEPSIIHLWHDERPLAPILSWPNDLQEYSDLFPQRHVLANAFFDAVDEENVWQMLETAGFIRTDVIIRDHREISSDMFKLSAPLEGEHESKEKFAVTDIAFLRTKDIGIIDRVRQSRPLAHKFWRFLTEWLLVHNSEGVEIIDGISCSCGETHQCYPAAWLVPLVNRQWIPSDGKSVAAKPETLANLLRGSELDLSSLNESDSIGKLLEAIGVSRFELMREVFIDSNNRDAVDNAMREIMIKSAGNKNLPKDLENLLEATDGNISEVTEIAENLKEDEEFKQVVDTRLKERRNIKQNRSLGITVEEIVGDHLKELNESFEVEVEDFEVDPIHKGADYVITLEVNQKWWIEVKSARTDRVKMSSAQAQNAKEKGKNFLLCVVPIEPGNTNPDPETVKENMTFIADINDRVAPLCKKIEQLEDVQTDINAESSSDIELVVEGGKASVIVKKSVWESDEAFPLGKLAEYLR